MSYTVVCILLQATASYLMVSSLPVSITRRISTKTRRKALHLLYLAVLAAIANIPASLAFPQCVRRQLYMIAASYPLAAQRSRSAPGRPRWLLFETRVDPPVQPRLQYPAHSRLRVWGHTHCPVSYSYEDSNMCDGINRLPCAFVKVQIT